MNKIDKNTTLTILNDWNFWNQDLPTGTVRQLYLKKCEDFIRSHLGVTEDIYPAMFYGVLALNSLGYPMNDTNIEKALMGLKSFQVIMSHKELHAVPFQDSSTIDYNLFKKQADDAHRDYMVYQQ